jgi:pyrimidine operon attenuation protein/uracil phosphoribosyltransferase
MKGYDNYIKLIELVKKKYPDEKNIKRVIENIKKSIIKKNNNINSNKFILKCIKYINQ